MWLPCTFSVDWYYTHWCVHIMTFPTIIIFSEIHNLYIFYSNAAITGSIIYQSKPKSYLSLCGPLCFLDFTVITSGWLIICTYVSWTHLHMGPTVCVNEIFIWAKRVKSSMYIYFYIYYHVPPSYMCIQVIYRNSLHMHSLHLCVFSVQHFVSVAEMACGYEWRQSRK